jgi:hypothetical protein
VLTLATAGGLAKSRSRDLDDFLPRPHRMFLAIICRYLNILEISRSRQSILSNESWDCSTKIEKYKQNEQMGKKISVKPALKKSCVVIFLEKNCLEYSAVLEQSRTMFGILEYAHFLFFYRSNSEVTKIFLSRLRFFRYTHVPQSKNSEFEYPQKS